MKIETDVSDAEREAYTHRIPDSNGSSYTDRQPNVSTRKCTATVSVTIRPQTVLGDAIYAAGGRRHDDRIQRRGVKGCNGGRRCVLVVRTHSERGSEVLEAAIVLPMLIVLAFCLIQVCLIAYEGTAMSAAIESAAMKSDFSAAIASGNVNQEVKDELASNTPGIVKNNITVTNSKVSYSDRSDEATVTDSGSTGITTISKSSTTALLESSVDYKVPTLISVGSFDGIKMSKTIKVEVPVSEKMEVSR